MNKLMKELAERFGTGEAQGERPDEGDGALFPDGSRVVECTNWARQVKRALGERVTIYGFAGEDNPDCEIVKRTGGGHDFAVVDDRYLVDGWAVDVEQLATRPVYDMRHRSDAVTVKRLYGERANWTDLDLKEFRAKKHKPARTPAEVLRSLVADIEAMQAVAQRAVHEAGFSNDNPTDKMPKDFFGPFACHYDHNDQCMVEGGDGVSIEWPNLAILLEEARVALYFDTTSSEEDGNITLHPV